MNKKEVGNRLIEAITELYSAHKNRRFFHGMTKDEVHAVLRKLKIHHKTFWKKFGVNTCGYDVKTGETLFYASDLETALRCCVEKREMRTYEWD